MFSPQQVQRTLNIITITIQFIWKLRNCDTFLAVI